MSVVSGATAGDNKTALSMGSGPYLAAKSEREIHEAESHRKRAELAENPDEGREEMSLIFQIKGIPQEEADRVAAYLAHSAAGAAKTLITVRSWWSRGLEMAAVGAAEGLVTYFIGKGLGGLA